MALTVKHPFVSAKGDGSDATLVRPSNWNASHKIEMATNKIIGRLTAGPGDAEELPVTSYMMGLLNTADYLALAVLLGLPTTGDAKLTFKIIADSGWVLANDGSIGSALSGGTTRAHADTVNLFAFFYNTFSDAVAPLQTSAGAGTTRVAQGTATAAYNANCRIVLPKQLGRALIIAGTGASLTARALGTVGGEETHTMTLAELVAHTHTQQGAFAGSGTGSGSITATGSGSFSGSTSINAAPDHLHGINGQSTRTGGSDRSLDHSHTQTWSGGTANNPVVAGSGPGGHGGGGAFGPAGTLTLGGGGVDHTHILPAFTDAADRTLNHSHTCSGSVSVTSISGSCSVTTVSVSTTISGQTVSTGSTTPFNVMQPWTAWNVMIRL